MHVSQLFYHLFVGKYVEIIGARIPKWRGISFLFGPTTIQAFPRYPLLEHLHGEGNISIVRFADEHVKVLRHHDITNNPKVILPPDVFKDSQEKVSAVG